MEPFSCLLTFAWEGSLVAECSLTFGLNHLTSWKWSVPNAMWCLRNWTFTQTEFSERRCWVMVFLLPLPFFAFPLMPSPHFFLTPILISSMLFLSPSLVFHLCSFTSSSFSSILLLSMCSLPLLLLLLPLFLLLLLFSHFLTVRRTPWPLWPLTPSLWACLCHQRAEQEVEVMKRGQVRPSQNASTSPTSRSASETQTSARCLGYKFLKITQIRNVFMQLLSKQILHV